MYVDGASEHTLSTQVPDAPLVVQVHDLAPVVARFPSINKNIIPLHNAYVVYVEQAYGGTHLVPSVVHYADMA